MTRCPVTLSWRHAHSASFKARARRDVTPRRWLLAPLVLALSCYSCIAGALDPVPLHAGGAENATVVRANASATSRLGNVTNETASSGGAAVAAPAGNASDVRVPGGNATSSGQTMPAAPQPLSEARWLPSPLGTLYNIGAFKVVKGVALTSSVLLQLSPIRTVREIRLAGSTKDYDSLPWFTLFFGALQWFCYGTLGILLTGNWALISVIQANILGVLLGAFYVYSFHENCLDGDALRSLSAMLQGGAALLSLEFFCVVLLTPQTSLGILGSICALFSTIVAASPLVALEDIFRTQSTATMQTDMVIVCFCGSCAWATLGVMLHDVCIALPNCFGIVIGSFQVHLILKFAGSDLLPFDVQRDETISVLFRDGVPRRIKPQPLGANYEASLYKRAKVAVLVFVANLQFLVANYMNFASTTVMEVFVLVAEIKNIFFSRKGGCTAFWSWARGKQRARKMDFELGENIGLVQ